MTIRRRNVAGTTLKCFLLQYSALGTFPAQCVLMKSLLESSFLNFAAYFAAKYIPSLDMIENNRDKSAAS